MISVVAGRSEGRGIEVGVYGRDGYGPSSILLGSATTPHRHFVQISGTAYRLAANDLLAAVLRSNSLHTVLLRYIHVFMTQTAHSVLVNGSASVEERLARWILMCRDRVDVDEFAITHDFLSMMLGVRRSSVTDAVHLLEGQQLIKATRGHIRIVDRAGLEQVAGSSYGLAEAEYRRLIGTL